MRQSGARRSRASKASPDGLRYDRDCLVGRQQEHDLGLDGIGVLELVDEEVAILLLQRAADLRVLAQHLRGQVQQVAVVQRVATMALASRRTRARA